MKEILASRFTQNPSRYPLGLAIKEAKEADGIFYGLYLRNGGIFNRLAITNNLNGFAILTRGDIVVEGKRKILDTRIFLTELKRLKAKGEIKIIKAEGQPWNPKDHDD